MIYSTQKRVDLEVTVQKSGLLIAIEGTDRLSISSQAKLLTERLNSDGYNVVHIQAIKPLSPEGYYIEKYESDLFEKLPINKPYTPVLFYALNHLAVMTSVQAALEDEKVIICDQYILTNYMTNITKNVDYGDFYDWLNDLEYKMLGIIRPDYSIIIGSLDDVRVTAVSSKLASTEYSIVEQSNDAITGNHADIWNICMNILNAHGVVKSKQLNTNASDNALESIYTKSDDVTFNYSMSCLAHSQVLQVQQNLNITYTMHSRDTRSIFYPDTLTTASKKLYRQTQDNLFENYNKFYDLIRKDCSDSVASMISEQIKPVATVNDITMSVDNAQVNKLGEVLRKCGNTEIINLAQSISKKPVISRVPDSSAEQDLIKTPLLGQSNKDISLASVIPKNELSLVGAILYPGSTLSNKQITESTTDLKYDTKSELLRSLASRPDLLNTEPLYTFELLIPLGIVFTLQKLNIGSIITQARTPHYGFAYPEQINTPELEALYDESFDIAFTAYQKLYEAGFPDEAQYCTLFGHKNRIKLTLNWPEVNILLSAKSNVLEFKKLQIAIKREIKAVHPILNDSV